MNAAPSKRGVGAPSVTSTRCPVSQSDGTGRPAEEDLLLYYSLKLIGVDEALQTWPELSTAKLEVCRSMFAAPNRTATETLLYFLQASLLERDVVAKTFKDVWPTTSSFHGREFRARAVEVLRQHAETWHLSPEIVTLLPALLQRNAGQKLVRLLCELCCAVLKAELRALGDAEDCSEEVPVDDEEAALFDRLSSTRIRIGHARIAQLQRRFLQIVAEGRVFGQEVRAIAGELMAVHASLLSQQEGLKQEMTPTRVPDPNPSPFSQIWQQLQSSLHALEGLGRVVGEVSHSDPHPRAVSGEEMLSTMAQTFGENFVRGSIDHVVERESSLFGSESGISITHQGKTEVDVLSMTWNWARFGVKEVTDALEPIGRLPRQAFVRDLIDDEGLPDLIQQTCELHAHHVEELERLKTELQEDIAKLDVALDVEEKRTNEHRSEIGSPLPTLLSILES